MDVSDSLPRFIELVLAPQEQGETDSFEAQRMALESLREARPGMLIDHIEETKAASSGPAKARPLFMRLRSHVEARTFDELRVFELGGLVRRGDPDWHEGIVELVYQGRAILVDTTGLIADPASEGVGRADRRSERSSKHKGQATPLSRPDALSPHSPPPLRASAAPSWSATPEQAPAIELPADPSPPPMGRPAPIHLSSTPSGRPRPAAPSPAQRRSPPGKRFFALCEGHLFCPTCAQPMTILTMGHERRLYYTCPSKHLHPSTATQPELYFPVDAVDLGVWSRLSAKLENPRLAIELVREAATKGEVGSQSRRDQVQTRLQRLERDELEVMKLRSEDRISEGAARHRLDEIATQRRKLQDELSSDSSANTKLRPLTKAIEELIAFQKRSSKAVDEADYGLRRRLVQASLPLTAEYGVFPHADGSLEVRDLLGQFSLEPGLRHRVRSFGRLAGSVKDRVSAARPRRSEGEPGRLGRVVRLLRRPSRDAVVDSSDLGKALRATMRDYQPLTPRAAPPRRASWLMYAFGLICAILVAILFQPAAVEQAHYDNQAQDMGLAEELTALHEVPGGWIGVAHPDWIGSTDKAVATQLCATLAAQLQPGPAETVTLMVPGGLPIAECRAPRQSTVGS